jgi:hypothetical protein
MPLYVQIDFRKDGRLGAWWSRDTSFYGLNTPVSETRVRDVLISLADQLDPLESESEESEDEVS